MNHSTLAALAALFLINLPMAAHAQKGLGKDPALDSTVDALCGEDRIYFDGACRGERYFGKLTANGFELRGFSGCSGPEVGSGSGCDQRASLTETKDRLTRTVTLSTASAEEPGKGTRSKPDPFDTTVHSAGHPMRGDYLVVSRTDIRSEARAGGDRAIDITVSTLDSRIGLRKIMTQNLLLDAVSDKAAGRDYTVAGQACFAASPANTGNLLSGSPDCSCLDEGRCMGGDYSTTGISITPVGKGYRYCATSSRYDDAFNGVLQSELEFDLLADRMPRKAQGGGKAVAKAPPKLNPTADGLTCYRVSGAAASGLLHAYNDPTGGGNSDCGPDIATGTDLGAVACNVTAAAVSGIAGTAATPYEVEFDMGIDGRPLSVKNVLVNAVENSVFAYEYLGELCASTGLFIAAVEITETFCLGSGQGGGSCEGTHTSVPVTVTATDGQTCSATADLDCRSSTGQAVDLLSPFCECSASSIQVDEASCR